MQEADAYNVTHSKDTPAGFGRWAESEVEFTCESNTALTAENFP